MSSRYERLELLGEGRQGVVYRAFDRERGVIVALKTLRVADSEGAFRLKNEFRGLAGLSHPNLVELYDLVIEGAQCFFTMELVDGTDVVRWAQALDLGATTAPLRRMTLQLVLAVGALHAAGKLHRDVKPSNVLVTSDGRVVVLDFGFGTGAAPRAREAAGTVVGTLPYLAPERLWGTPGSPAADWYAVGATLYEALAGRPPFTETELVALADGSVAAPVPPPLAPSVPADLGVLIGDLLRREPAARPSFEEIVRRLTERAPDPPPAWRASYVHVPLAFVGRSRELALMDAAYQATRWGGAVLDVLGVSGIGKTALVERFLDHLESEERLVTVRGRCHPHEAIPFKAVDGVVDDLSRLLASQSEAGLAPLLPADVAALVRVFPVLGRVPAIAAAATATLEGEPHEVRRRAFGALRELLARLAIRRPLGIWIDDLQWGDVDSMQVVRELCRPPMPPGVLVIRSFRAEDRDDSEVLRRLAADEDELEPMVAAEEIEVRPLSAEDTVVLARGALATAPRPATARDLAVIAAESGGSPFLAGELVRYYADRCERPDWSARLAIGEVVEQRVARLPEASRRVLEVVAVAGRPLDEALIAGAAAVDDARATIQRLRHAHLLRAVVAGTAPAIATYHDRIRAAVAGALAEDARRAIHRRLAAVLEARPNPEPLFLVDHYLQAGEPRRAANYAFSSAERAAAALAFHQAAALYRRAVELGTTACPRWEAAARLAEALVNAGYGGQAGAAYEAAAADLAMVAPASPKITELRRLSADQYLRSGHIDAGLAILRQVLAATGLRYYESTSATLAALVVSRARLQLARWLRPEPRPTAMTARDRERLETCWTAGLGVSVFDSIRGAEFQVRHALLSRATDDPSHRARSLSTEAVVLAMEGAVGRRRRIDALQAAAQRLVLRSRDPRAEAHALLMSAGVAFFDNRYREAVALCDRGVTLCRERCVGTAWELANMQFLGAYALAYLGELARLQERVPAMLRQAHERGDHFALTNYRVGMIVLAWLARDAPDEARRQLDAALAGRTPHRSAWQHYMGMYGHVQVDLYASCPERAWARLRETLPALRRAQMLRLESVRLESRLLRARCAVALAARADGRARARWLRRAARTGRRIGRERARWAGPLAAAVAASVAAVRGDVTSAARELAVAARGFDALDLGLHAAAARWHLAALMPAMAGDELRRQQAGWMTRQAIVAPARMVATLLPGFAG